MLKFNLLIVASLLLTGCGQLLAPIFNRTYTHTDKFTGDRITSFSENCSVFAGSFCSDFKVINGRKGYMYLGYEGEEWRYLESIWLKIEGEDDYMRFSGHFDLIPTDDPDYPAKERLKVKITKDIYDFIKRSLGKTVHVRMHGEVYYYDESFKVGKLGSHRQWSLLVEALTM